MGSIYASYDNNKKRYYFYWLKGSFEIPKSKNYLFIRLRRSLFDSIREEGNYNYVYLKIKGYRDVAKYIQDCNTGLKKARLDFKVVPTEELERQFHIKNLQLEKRQKIGISIKNEEEFIENQEEYKRFCEIVNNSMERRLKDKQLNAAYFKTKIKRTMNFSVPGSGKTSMVYGAFAYLNSKEINQIDRLVVIAPKNAEKSWRDEFISNFGMKKELRFHRIGGKIYSTIDVFSANVVFVNYERVNSNKRLLQELINSRTMLVLDESHRIKLVDGVRANSVKAVCTEANYIISLTGTPIPNDYEDLLNMLTILYQDDSDFFGFDLTSTNESTRELIRKELNPFFYRINKEELNVPAVNEDIIINVEPTPAEIEINKMIWEKDVSYLAKFHYLLKSQSSPEAVNNKPLEEEEEYDIYLNSSFDEDDRLLLTSGIDSSKIKATVELINQLVTEGKKVMVWGVYVHSIKKLHNILVRQGINAAKIHGSVPNEERENIINGFNKGNIEVLISNPQTLAESVSLHHACHDAIYFELNLNMASFSQSKDRIHRLGIAADQETQYYFVFNEYEKSIDKMIYDTLLEKENRMKDIIDGGKIGIEEYNTNETEIINLIKSLED